LKFLDFKQHFKPFKVFSVQDILKWDSSFDTRRLVEWQDKGYLKKIINRWYMFADVRQSDNFHLLVANRIYSPSYISFESAWAYYGLIPEGVYTITSATSLKPHTFSSPIGSFAYRHLKPSLLFGFRLIEAGGQFCKIAEPEKLVLDHLYLHPSLKTREDFESLRINRAMLKEQVMRPRLDEYLKLFKNKLLDKRVHTFYNTFGL
jgi:predicted transcriptional regulator of viral defense system